MHVCVFSLQVYCMCVGLVYVHFSRNFGDTHRIDNLWPHKHFLTISEGTSSHTKTHDHSQTLWELAQLKQQPAPAVLSCTTAANRDNNVSSCYNLFHAEITGLNWVAQVCGVFSSRHAKCLMDDWIIRNHRKEPVPKWTWVWTSLFQNASVKLSVPRWDFQMSLLSLS